MIYLPVPDSKKKIVVIFCWTVLIRAPGRRLYQKSTNRLFMQRCMLDTHGRCNLMQN